MNTIPVSKEGSFKQTGLCMWKDAATDLRAGGLAGRWQCLPQQNIARRVTFEGLLKSPPGGICGTSHTMEMKAVPIDKLQL